MISAAPDWGDKGIYWNTGGTLLTFVQLYKPTVSTPCLERLSSYFFYYFSHTPCFNAVTACYKSAALFRTWQFLLEDHSLGVPDTTTIFQDWAKSFIRCLFYILRSLIKTLPQKTECSVCCSTYVAYISYPIFLPNT